MILSFCLPFHSSLLFHPLFHPNRNHNSSSFLPLLPLLTPSPPSPPLSNPLSPCLLPLLPRLLHFRIVSHLSSLHGLSPSMAAVALLALGNGAPDAFASIAALCSSPGLPLAALLLVDAVVSAFVVGPTTNPFQSLLKISLHSITFLLSSYPLSSAHRLFDKISQPNLVTYNVMLTSFRRRRLLRSSRSAWVMVPLREEALGGSEGCEGGGAKEEVAGVGEGGGGGELGVEWGPRGRCWSRIRRKRREEV